MSSITIWNRIEPRVRSTSLTSVEARLYDPLWLLGRQWQVGEFDGEDAGTPVRARLVAEHNRLSRFQPRDGRARPYDPGERPLDAEVAREPIGRKALRSQFELAAQLGRAFLEGLEAEALGKRAGRYLREYPLEAPKDDSAAGLAAVVAGRVPDGLAMLAELRKERPGRASATDEQAAIARWLDLCERLGLLSGAVPAAWDDSRLEYRFAVSTRLSDGEIALRADEYDGAGIDWHSFDVDPDLELGAPSVPRPTQIRRTTMPSPVSYRGMPLPRWWEFEDARVHFGSVEAAPEDVGRMLLMEFALVYGNDFFAIPLELPLGCVCRIESLEVTDCFGVTNQVPHASAADGANAGWHMFELTSATGGTAPGLLVLPPSASDSLNGTALEQVMLLRDEQANMAWAVEQVVEGADGRPRRRFEEWQAKRAREAAAADAAGIPSVPATDAPLRYRVATPPPEHWLPLVPVKDSAGRLLLELRNLLDDSTPPRPLPPRGRLLQTGQLIWEEEIPRDGREVTRRWRHARWLGGRALHWEQRLVRPGRGEGSSGLRFDVAEQEPGP